MGVSMYRPMSFLEFQDLKNNGAELQCTCILCNEEFSNKNVHSAMGWRETQITGYCENCWDALFEDLDEADQHDTN